MGRAKRIISTATKIKSLFHNHGFHTLSDVLVAIQTNLWREEWKLLETLGG